MSAPEEETMWDKGIRKFKNEPLVPIGALVTVAFLSQGLRAFHRGNQKQAQLLMRGRVLAQACTVIIMGIGAYFGLKPHDRPTNIEEIITRGKRS